MNNLANLTTYSYLPNKRAYTPYLILVQPPPYMILFGTTGLTFGYFNMNDIQNFFLG